MSNRIISFVVRLKNAAGEGLKNVIDASKDAAKTVDESFTDAFSKTRDESRHTADRVKEDTENASKGFKTFEKRSESAFKNSESKSKSFSKTVLSGIKSAANAVKPLGLSLANIWHRSAQLARSFFASVRDRMKGFAGNFANIKAGFDMLATGARTAVGAIRSVVGAVQKSIVAAFDRETLETRFEVLLGSAEKAAAHVKMLAEVGRTTPFSTENIANASQALIAYTQAALGGKDSILLIGDAAAATGGNIEELAMWTGRLYAAMKGGQSLGEMLARLVELKVVTPELRRELEQMSATGASFDDMWSVYSGALSDFSGGMVKLANTGNGLFSTFRDNVNEAFVSFGRALMDVSKNGLRTMISAIDKLTASGELEKWAGEVRKLLEPLVGIMQNIFAGGETRKIQVEALKNQFKAFSDYLFERLKLAFEYGAEVLGAKLNPFKGKEGEREQIAAAAKAYHDGVAKSFEKLQSVYEQNSTKSVAARGAKLDDPTGAKAREEREAAQRAAKEAEDRKREAESAKQKREEAAKREAERQAERATAIEAAKDEEQKLRAQIANADEDVQVNQSAIDDKKAFVEQSRREQQNLEAKLADQKSAWSRRSLEDVDRAMSAEKIQRAQAKEAARFDRRVEQAKASLARVGGDESKLSRRDRLILGMDKKNRENIRRTEDEIKKHQKDRQDALNHMLRLEAAAQQAVRQRDQLTKLLEQNLQFQGGN